MALFVSETLIFWQNSISMVKEYSQRWFLHSPPSTEKSNDLQSTEGTNRPSLPCDL
jgi:hypothetical protein